MSPRIHTLIAALAAALLLRGATAEPYDPTDPYSRRGSRIGSDALQYDDSKDVPWREEGITVPPPPGENTELVEVAMDELPKGFKAYLDLGSVTVNPLDRATRYWLVVRSGASANVSYEGVNCATRELKVYAYADPRGAVRPVPKPEWKPLGFARANDYHWALADGYLCSGTSPRDPKELISALKGRYSFGKWYSEYTENLRPER